MAIPRTRCATAGTPRFLNTLGIEVFPSSNLPFFFFFFVFFAISWAVPVAYRGSWARGQIGGVAAGLYHSSQQGQILNLLGEARD